MQLSQLSLANPLAMNWHSKRSLLQLHTLFLGLLIEPYRYGLINLGRYRLNNNGATMALHDLEALENVEKEKVEAVERKEREAKEAKEAELQAEETKRRLADLDSLGEKKSVEEATQSQEMENEPPA